MTLKPIKGIFDAALADDPRITKAGSYALNTTGGCQQTYVLSRTVLERRIPGVFVECGTAYGAQLAIMAMAMERLNDRREIHGYDSFAGIPCAGPKDSLQPGLGGFQMDRNLPLEKRLVGTKSMVADHDTCREMFYAWKIPGVTLELHKGWFQHTLPDNKLGTIAFLRLDGDLYESTEICLRYLYDKVAPGGIVYVDDWCLSGPASAVEELFEERKLTAPIYQDKGGCVGAAYWFK